MLKGERFHRKWRNGRNIEISSFSYNIVLRSSLWRSHWGANSDVSTKLFLWMKYEKRTIFDPFERAETTSGCKGRTPKKKKYNIWKEIHKRTAQSEILLQSRTKSKRKLEQKVYIFGQKLEPDPWFPILSYNAKFLKGCSILYLRKKNFYVKIPYRTSCFVSEEAKVMSQRFQFCKETITDSTQGVQSLMFLYRRKV